MMKVARHKNKKNAMTTVMGRTCLDYNIQMTSVHTWVSHVIRYGIKCTLLAAVHKQHALCYPASLSLKDDECKVLFHSQFWMVVTMPHKVSVSESIGRKLPEHVQKARSQREV